MGNGKYTIKNIREYLHIRWNSILWSINKKTARYLASVHERSEQEKIKEWESRFNGEPFFEFIFDNNIKINLYKDSILSKVIVDGFEENEFVFMKKFLSAGDTFLDIGSNIGLFSLSASSIVGKNGKVIAFEPSPTTFKRLLENIELNKFTNIDARNIGLSDKVGKLEMQQSENGFDAWNTFVRADSEKFQKTICVEVSTLDVEIKDLSQDSISLIKLDVEGWEKFVLQGGVHFLTHYSPALLVEFTESNTFSAGYFVQEIYTLLEEMGYRWYRYENKQLVPDPIRLHYPYNNLVATKNQQEVLKRINR